MKRLLCIADCKDSKLNHSRIMILALDTEFPVCCNDVFIVTAIAHSLSRLKLEL